MLERHNRQNEAGVENTEVAVETAIIFRAKVVCQR